MMDAKRDEAHGVAVDFETAAKGAYLLVVDLAAPLRLVAKALAGQVLQPGRYAYCGSAYGPGGLGARLGRHLRAVKTRRWHVDELTRGGEIAAIAALPGGSECRLLAELCRRPGIAVPLPGFGSSDCRRCPSHLLRLAAELDLSRLALPWIDIQGLGKPKIS